MGYNCIRDYLCGLKVNAASSHDYKQKSVRKEGESAVLTATVLLSET